MKNVWKLAFSVLLILFITVQWQLLSWLQHSSQDEEVVHGADDHQKPDDKLKSKVIHENIKVFAEVCHSLSLPVILVDPAILSRVSHLSGQTGYSRKSCKFLCEKQEIITFAILNSFWQHEEELYDSLISQGFKISFHVHEASWMTDNTEKKPLPVHYIFHRQGHWIQLVILYDRFPVGATNEPYLWTGKLILPGQYINQQNTQAIFLPQSVLTLGLTNAAFDRFAVAKVSMDGVNFRAPQYIESFLNQIKDSSFIECNKTQANSFYDTYGKDVSEEADLFRSLALETIKKAKMSLDALHIRFWISSGTCLGWYRQCDLIPYSKDVDIGIWIKDYKEGIVSALQMNELNPKFLFGKVNDSYELSFQGNEVKLDIFFFYEEDTYMWNGGTQARTGKKYKYIFPKFHLCRTELLGLFVRVPCNTEEYIKANYGEEWFVPVKVWDWKKSPPNVVENGEWPREEWPAVIRTF